METLLTNLSLLGHNPFAWAVAALVGLRAAFSVYMTLRCPVARGVYQPTREEAEAAANERFGATRGYLLLMVVGMALAIGGLYTIANDRYGAVALGALVVGVFLIMTEPSRLQVTAAVKSVYASTLRGAEHVALARESLQGAHVQRTMIEVVIALFVFAALALI